jgi:predicted transcriptional regulator
MTPRNATDRDAAPLSAELGELEHAVMQQIWQLGPTTAEAVREALLPDRPLKDSTIRTVLRRLEEKGFVSHSLDNRTFLYKAAVDRQRVAATAVKRIMDWFLDGSAEELLVGMVDTEMLDRKELQRLAAKIAQAQSRKGGK